MIVCPMALNFRNRMRWQFLMPKKTQSKFTLTWYEPSSHITPRLGPRMYSWILRTELFPVPLVCPYAFMYRHANITIFVFMHVLAYLCVDSMRDRQYSICKAHLPFCKRISNPVKYEKQYRTVQHSCCLILWIQYAYITMTWSFQNILICIQTFYGHYPMKMQFLMPSPIHQADIGEIV